MHISNLVYVILSSFHLTFLVCVLMLRMHQQSTGSSWAEFSIFNELTWKKTGISHNHNVVVTKKIVLRTRKLCEVLMPVYSILIFYNLLRFRIAP